MQFLRLHMQRKQQSMNHDRKTQICMVHLCILFEHIYEENTVWHGVGGCGAQGSPASAEHGV